VPPCSEALIVSRRGSNITRCENSTAVCCAPSRVQFHDCSPPSHPQGAWSLQDLIVVDFRVVVLADLEGLGKDLGHKCELCIVNVLYSAPAQLTRRRTGCGGMSHDCCVLGPVGRV